MFGTNIVPYSRVVSAARDTAEKICAQGSRPVRVNVTTKGGSTASVAWTRSTASLNLPTIPAGQIMTRAEANRMVGLVAHECCHVMHSDWDAWLQAVRAGEGIKSLTNAIEDVRIEAKEISRRNLPGLRDALSDTCVMMHGKSLTACADSGAIMGSRAEHAAYIIAMMGRLKNGYTIPNAADIAQGIAPAWRPAIDHALAQLSRVNSTTHARVLAEQVFAMLQQAAASQPKPPQRDDGQDDGKDAKDDGQQAGSDDTGSGGDSNDAEADASGTEDDGQDDGSESDSDGDISESDGDGDDDGSEDSSDSDNDASGDGHGNLSNSADDWLDASPDVDDIAKDKNAPPSLDEDAEKRARLNLFRGAVHNGVTAWQQADRAACEAMLRDRIARPAVLADSVSRLVLSEARNTHDRYLAAGRLDRRAIGRASWGATNVFARRAYAPGIETAVFLLVDGSESMIHDSRILDAQSLAYYLGQAIDDAGAQSMIAAFHNIDPRHMVGSNGANGTAFQIQLRIAKHWHEPVDATKLAELRPMGTTPLSPAIIAASEELAGLRDVDRRILLALTDGQCDLGHDAVKDACAIANLLGVEVGGVGIGGTTQCEKAFPLGVDLGRADDISEAGLRLLVDMLERRRG